MKEISRNRQKKALFIEALKKNLNVVTAACEATGVSRATYYQWIRDDEEFRKEVEELPEIQMDFVEVQLLKKIKEGSDAAIIFYLKTKGKKRGYNDKLEIDGNINHNVSIIRLSGPQTGGEDEKSAQQD